MQARNNNRLDKRDCLFFNNFDGIVFDIIQRIDKCHREK